MVLDTSALLAVLLQEADAVLYAQLIYGAERCSLSTVSYLEAVMVLEKTRTSTAETQVKDLLRLASIQIKGFSSRQAELAAEAFLRFGKGRHPAKLNFGDCMVYGLAKSLNEPVLCKGNDFRQTDLVCLP